MLFRNIKACPAFDEGHGSEELKENIVQISFQKRCLAWSIHVFTACGAFFGLMALLAIYNHELLQSFWWMMAAIIIDAVDGMLARSVNIKQVVPNIDGALLDNIVDFFTYSLVPCFFLLVSDVLPPNWQILGVIVIIIASAYQFTQIDAKTSDHFFKGFPSYWNIVVFYLFFWQMNSWVNLSIVILLAVLSFVPIKYVYLSRLDYLTRSKSLRIAMLVATALWSLATAGLLWVYPQSNQILVFVSIGYILLYAGISLYRTWVPLS